MLYFTGSHLFPSCTQGKELLYLLVVNHLMSSAAWNGPRGHSSRGSIKLRPLLMSPWLLHLGEHLCCANSGKAALCSTDQYCFTGLTENEIPDPRLPWRGHPCHPFIHSFIHSGSLVQVASLSHPLIQPTTACPFEGRKWFLWRENLVFYSFPVPGSSLKTVMLVILCFDFAYSELERVWQIFCVLYTLTEEVF